MDNGLQKRVMLDLVELLARRTNNFRLFLLINNPLSYCKAN